MKPSPPIEVRLADGAESGLAMILQQYLEQDLAEFEGKRRQAGRLQGRLAMTAVDHDVTVTVEFRGREIAIWDGQHQPVDASIVGPYERLVQLIQGRAHPLWEHLRGRLRVRSRLRRPFFPLHAYNLMKLPPEGGAGRRAWAWALAALATGAAAAAATAVILRAT